MTTEEQTEDQKTNVKDTRKKVINTLDSRRTD